MADSIERRPAEWSRGFRVSVPDGIRAIRHAVLTGKVCAWCRTAPATRWWRDDVWCAACARRAQLVAKHRREGTA